VDITERKRLDDQRRARLERMELLEGATRAIGDCVELPAIYQAALRSVEDSFGVDFAAVFERTGEDRFMSVAATGPKSLPVAQRLALEDRASVAFNQDAFERCMTGEIGYEPDLATSFARFPERLARVEMRSLVVAPLVIEGRVAGALLCARRAVNGFTEEDREFLAMLARHLSYAVRHVRRYDAVQRTR
jgi:GAF domain-containing protein